jgi:hypothetical protein
VFKSFAKMMQEVVTYDIEFMPITDDVYQCVNEAYDKIRNVDIVYDIAATFPNSVSTPEYNKLGDGFGDEKFDQFKYRKLNVPFNLKWTLNGCISIDADKENSIYNEVVNTDKYAVVSTKHSRGNVNIKFDSKYPVIEVNEKYNIFYWRKILTNASKIAVVDSAIANLIEGLNINTPKILIRKPGQPTPVFKNNWAFKDL